MAGATRFPAWRRALRPASQSSHEMGLSAAIEGIFRFEFTSNLYPNSSTKAMEFYQAVFDPHGRRDGND
jgi:hypothetical protein